MKLNRPPSSDTYIDIPCMKMIRDADEELRSLRAERRNKRKKRDREKKIITKEIPIGEAGVDKGYEKYIDSSVCDSDDSTNKLDAEAVGGVDLPGRRKSKKVRYDDQCTIAIFELGMIFENAKEFRKALAKYLECVLDTPGLIGVKDGRERKGENNSGDVPRQLLK
ncbi:hypothetical protein H5410_064797 [Solanum commersonii]|uniref:Uncharacterized protein n=1 Tax=Solanum commersonii TaxID=4109 RepID=A0A9J5VYH9_SOLCO|nr:hypothetical protein H5410_064797 [Solanum commersonii]